VGGGIEDVVRESYKGSITANAIRIDPAVRFQSTLGLKMMVLEDIFYYQGKEVRRR
jgi:hypothetical protein